MKKILLSLSLLLSGHSYGQIWLLDANGCRFYDQYEKIHDGIIIEWNGGCKGGYLTGKGTFRKFKDGELVIVFKGELENGKYKNFVHWTWPNGNIYEGDLRNNNMTGKGKFIWSNGNVYEGDFVNGERHGKGKFTWTNGERYEGDFINNVRNGKGKFFHKNGDVYEGNFMNNKYQGWGKFIYAHGDIFEGEFKNGFKNGTGKYDFSNSTTYSFHKGTYKNDKKNGPGKLFYPDGTFIEGNWNEDVMTIVQPHSKSSSSSSSSVNKADIKYSNYIYDTKENNNTNQVSNQNPSTTKVATKYGYSNENNTETASSGNAVMPSFKWEYHGYWNTSDNGQYKRALNIIKNGSQFKSGAIKYVFKNEDNTFYIDIIGLEKQFSFSFKPEQENQLVNLNNKIAIKGVKDLESAFFQSMQYAFDNLYR